MKKNQILVLFLSLIFLVHCNGKKSEQKTDNTDKNTESTEANNESKTAAERNNLDFSKPCSWLEASAVKAILELDEEVKSKVAVYPKNTCQYEWEKGEGLSKKYGLVTISFDKKTVFESNEEATKNLQKIVEVSNKGIKTEVKTNKDTEKVMEGKGNDGDGKVKVNFQLKYARVDKEAGFPAAFYVPNPKSVLSHTLMFVTNNRIMTIQINFYDKTPEALKNYAIALAKKLRGN